MAASTALSTARAIFASHNAISADAKPPYLLAPAHPPLLCKQEVTGRFDPGWLHQLSQYAPLLDTVLHGIDPDCQPTWR
jgi:hypothetical protein